MSIRVDPRRLGTLKQLAAEAGVRPGDLVRQWVEERIDESRGGTAPGGDVRTRLEQLEARMAALESSRAPTAPADEPAAEPPPIEEPVATEGDATPQPPADGRPRRSATAAPSGPRVGLHDEMIAVIAERGPLSAGELATAITERGRYAPPRSGKTLDAATVSQRASNPTYRSRFVRREGRIGLAQAPDEE
jgi:hypothetical protein